MNSIIYNTPQNSTAPNPRRYSFWKIVAWLFVAYVFLRSGVLVLHDEPRPNPHAHRWVDTPGRLEQDAIQAGKTTWPSAEAPLDFQWKSHQWKSSQWKSNRH